jgi:aryl-alcohol dehydrogenase-like predicted oxidoreductase
LDQVGGVELDRALAVPEIRVEVSGQRRRLEVLERVKNLTVQVASSCWNCSSPRSHSRPGVASVIAGATTPEQVEANAAAGD